MSIHQLAAPYRWLTHVQAQEIRIALGNAIHLTFHYGTEPAPGEFAPDMDISARSAGIGTQDYADFLAAIDGSPMTEAGLSQALMQFMDARGLFNS